MAPLASIRQMSRQVSRGSAGDYQADERKLKPILTEEEMDYFRRGKNAHTHAAPKSASRQEYAKATGFETLFGALYLLGRKDRLLELFAICMED